MGRSRVSGPDFSNRNVTLVVWPGRRSPVSLMTMLTLPGSVGSAEDVGRRVDEPAADDAAEPEVGALVLVTDCPEDSAEPDDGATEEDAEEDDGDDDALPEGVEVPVTDGVGWALLLRSSSANSEAMEVCGSSSTSPVRVAGPPRSLVTD